MRRLLWILAFVFCALTRPVAAPEAGLTVSPVVAPASTTPVWVNTHSHVYHFPGSVWYGRTIHGKYLPEAEAIAEGDRAAKNERRQTNDGAAPAPAPEHPPAPEPTPAPLAATVANAFVPTPEPTPAASVAPTPVPLEPGEPLSVCLQAIAAQSDPAKLATLGERAANPRLKRILYYLAQARRGGTDPGEVHDLGRRTLKTSNL